MPAGEMTRVSESKTRSVAAIGNNRVIPADAGIQCLATNDAGFPLARERRTLWASLSGD